MSLIKQLSNILGTEFQNKG